MTSGLIVGVTTPHVNIEERILIIFLLPHIKQVGCAGVGFKGTDPPTLWETAEITILMRDYNAFVYSSLCDHELFYLDF